MTNIVLLIGGGIQEIEAVKQLKDEGIIVWVIDKDSNCPSAKYADKLIKANGKDYENITQAILKKNNGSVQIRSVFTLTELTISTTIISHALGLISPTIKSVIISQSKSLSKLYWLKNKVSTPKGTNFSNLSEFKKHNQIIKYPVIVKPDIGFGGNGITMVKNKSELFRAINQASKISENNQFIVENYISGSLHDGNGFFTNFGKFIPLSVSDRNFSLTNKRNKGSCPSLLSEKQQKKFFNLFENACRAIGLNFGPVKIDALFNGKRFFVLEVAARLHGPRNSLHLIPNAYGKELLPELIESQIEDKAINWDYKKIKNKSTFEDFTFKSNSKIKKIKQRHNSYIQLFDQNTKNITGVLFNFEKIKKNNPRTF